jgi:phage tail sheath protein FI
VSAFLDSLQQEGAFSGQSASENYFVICDERVNDAAQVAAGRCQLLFGFAISRPGDFQACLVTHERAGSSARPVSVNRYALSPQS